MGPLLFVRRVAARAEELRAVRHEARAYAAAQGVADPDGLTLALGEALNNVVVHAYAGAIRPGHVDVVVEPCADEALRVVVCDRGRGIAPRVCSPGGGLGLPIMAAVCDELHLQPRRGGGTRVSMRFAATG